MQFTTVALSALLGLASAQTVHVVSVSGGNNTLVFSPEKLKAAAGDMVQFQFRAGNHSVVQSDFDNPCTPIAMHTNKTGIFSGYNPVAASAAMGMIPTYTIMIADTTPMWMYCSQGKHCQAGMTMVINENTAKNASRSLEGYKALAKVAPQNLPGGATNTGTSGGTSGTTTTGTGSTTTGSGATTTATAGASALGVSSTFSLVGAVAALFLL